MDLPSPKKLSKSELRLIADMRRIKVKKTHKKDYMFYVKIVKKHIINHRLNQFYLQMNAKK